MGFESYFDNLVKQENDKRKKEHDEYMKRVKLRTEWIDYMERDLHFLTSHGFVMKCYCEGHSEPYIHIAKRGKFVDISSEHIWNDSDFLDTTFYVRSNDSAFPCKARRCVEDVLNVVSKWI